MMDLENLESLRLEQLFHFSRAKSHGMLHDTLLVNYQGIFVRMSRIIIVLLFNTLITKHNFIAEKLETIFIFPFFSSTHEITFIAGYLLTTVDEYSVHHDHIWAMFLGVLNNKTRYTHAKALTN